MRHPMRDLVVVVPGIMGSTLYRHGRPVWAPSGRAALAALLSLAGSLKALQLPIGIGDEPPGDGVEARQLMPDLRLPLGLWTFDLGYDALLHFLRERFELSEDEPGRPGNLIRFAYDWRLSNRCNGEALGRRVEDSLGRWREQGGDRAEAEVVFICHSMGGLVARWYLDHLRGAEVTRKLITLGTPHRGSLNALEQLCNGVAKGPRPVRVDLTELGRSLPSLHQLLPEYAAVTPPGATAGTLARTTAVRLPELDSAMVRDAMDFHLSIDAARAGTPGRSGTKSAYQLHPIIGFEQPTWTTAQLAGGRVVPQRTIGGEDERGDATVPRLAGTPPDVGTDEAIISYVACNHGGLVHSQAVFDQIEGVLTANPVLHRGGRISLSVEVPEVIEAGEDLVVRAALPGGERVSLEVVLRDGDGHTIGPPARLQPGDGCQIALVEIPGPGVYLSTVRGVGAAGAEVDPITTATTAWPPEAALEPR